jgi:hypothetical protein
MMKNIRYELSNMMFSDKTLSDFLLRNGLLQIGYPYIGNYDPICFDCRKPEKDNEYPIVTVNHEEILCGQKLQIVNRISSSFTDFIGDS